MDHESLVDKVNKAKVDVIKIDLDLAITFAKIARESEDKEAITRNQLNARRAYDSVTHYLSTAVLTQVEEENIKTKLEYLKNALADLGEPF